MTEGKAPQTAKKRRSYFFPLNGRMLAMLLLSGILAWLVSSGVKTLGDSMIETRYMSVESQQQRQQALLASLQEYVSENQVRSDDSAALSAWCRQVKNVYLGVYKNGEEVIGTDGEYITEVTLDGYTDNERLNRAQAEAALANSTAPTETDASAAADYSVYGAASEGSEAEYEHPSATVAPSWQAEDAEQEQATDWYSGAQHDVAFADGHNMVSLIEFSEITYYSMVQAISTTAAVMVVLGTMLLYTASLTRRLTGISRMVARVASGDLEVHITPRGHDELYRLAADVEEMRNAIVQRLHNEQKAWQANQQLITAISHDIRNPLTSLLGYTDLLANGQVQDAVLQKQYLRACREKAYQLKELTDELFGYFVVFGSPTLKVEAEQLDLCVLLEQLLGEAVFRLRAEGQPVEYTTLPDDSPLTATVDVMLLKRIFDNLFSNISKYADRTCPVMVTARRSGSPTEGVEITLTNGIPPVRTRTESNCIGLRTCAKIAQELGVGFSSGKTQDAAGQPCYTAQLYIPARAGAASDAPPTFSS